MLYETASQGAEFVALLLAGAAMGALSGLFAWLRRRMRAGILLALACDALLGAAWAAVACCALYRVCFGQVRAYHVLAMLSGACLFRGAVCLPLRKACARSAAAMSKRLRTLANTRFVRRLLR